MEQNVQLLLPWEFSPLVLAVCLGALLLYGLGMARGADPGAWRMAGFIAGIMLFYAVTQTRYDYYSQYLFFAHRGQHLILHHVAPFLVALSAPGAVFSKALEGRWSVPQPLDGLRASALKSYRAVQNPWIAGTLFVGLIAFWLTPGVHFDAMLSRPLYWFMNWSMALDGLLFWWLVFAHGEGITPRLRLGARLLLLVLVIPPQILIGALIAFSDTALFDVYDVCGRAFPIAPLDDQQMGGLITWVPAVMMSMAGVLILLGRYLWSAPERAEG